MSNPNECIVRAKAGFRHEHLVRLHPEKLPPVAEDAAQSSTERKFNMRIKKHDRLLLDTLAKTTGQSRSELISKLLHHILYNELMSIEEADARMLIAEAADGAATYDPMARHWTIDLLARDIDWMARNVMEHGQVEEAPPLQDGEEWRHSQEFLALRTKLKEIGQ